MLSALKYFLVLYSAVLFSVSEVPTTSQWINSGALAVLSTASNVGLALVSTPQCRWCTPNNFDLEIGRALVLNNLELAAVASHFITFGVIPVTALAATAHLSKTAQQFALNALVLFDSAMATLAITHAIKVSTRREIPEVFFGFPFIEDRRKNLSFLSGHTSFALSLLSTASVLAFREKVAWAPYFTACAAGAGLLVAYSRLASAKHWTTDVLAGIGLGIAVGTAMPFLIYEFPGEHYPKILKVVPSLLEENLMVNVLVR